MTEKDDLPGVYVPNVAAPSNDQEVLAYTQHVRADLLNTLLSSEDKTDPKMLNAIDKLLNGMDKQVISMARVRAAEKTADAVGDVAQALDNYYRNRPEPPKIVRHDDAIEGEYRPVVPELPTREFIEGQLDPVGAPVDIEDILRRGAEEARK